MSSMSQVCSYYKFSGCGNGHLMASYCLSWMNTCTSEEWTFLLLLLSLLLSIYLDSSIKTISTETIFFTNSVWVHEFSKIISWKMACNSMGQEEGFEINFEKHHFMSKCFQTHMEGWLCSLSHFYVLILWFDSDSHVYM